MELEMKILELIECELAESEFGASAFAPASVGLRRGKEKLRQTSRGGGIASLDATRTAQRSVPTLAF